MFTLPRLPLASVALLCGSLVVLPAIKADPIPVGWLGGEAPTTATGVSFGVPALRGTLSADTSFTLSAPDGTALPTQTWPLATWPDGSLKWIGVATVAPADTGGEFHLAASSGAPAETSAAIRITHSDTTTTIDTGPLQMRLPLGGHNTIGTHLIDALVVDGREVARDGRLVALLQDGPDDDLAASPSRELYDTRIDQVTLEQSGPVRAVVKIEGVHLGIRTRRALLPFVVRLYVYAGSEHIRVVHSFVYDGDQYRDVIRGLGIRFDVPFREELQNRHVRFSGQDGGLWDEPVQPMVGRGGRFSQDPATGNDVYPTQVAGRRVPNRAAYDPRSASWLSDWASWDAFKLVQSNADGFTVEKRTNPASAWIAAGAGQRSSGFAFVGDVSGGLGLSVKNFWQSYPASLEITRATTDAATLTAWLWSPDGPAMDLRPYDTRGHGLQAAYEDVQPGHSDPHGIARTSELMLFPTAAVPSHAATAALAQTGAAPPLLLPTPAYLHAAQAFGHWGLADDSTSVKATVEKRLSRTLDFYLTQPEQQHWYGFWDFGDVMHSYDDVRHVWRYDLGGMAWDNSELGTDMWLWYSFLRTGRADVFRMAEAMARHTGEVDCYHLGQFAGLGSRHNVRHWGGGAKEARISQAAYRRFYYYLTTDERTGDVMREMLNVDFKTIEFDPMRLAQPITDRERALAPTRVRLGPDWFAFVSNWMTEWERTGDTQWRDKILAGVDSLAGMQYGLRSGKNLVFGYDPATGRLYQISDEAGVYNLATIMGGAEVVFELNQMLDSPTWKKLWLDYCRLYDAPKDVLQREKESGNAEGTDGSYTRDGRLAAYLYRETQNPAYLDRAVASLLGTDRPRGREPREAHRVDGPVVLNPIDEGLGNTNSSAQSGLETISILVLVGDQLPVEAPAPANP